MAHLTSFHSVDMSGSIFVEDEALSIASANDMRLAATGHAIDWNFAGNAIHSFIDSNGDRQVDSGTISAARYFTGGGGVPIFQSLDIPNVSAKAIWDAFQLGDNATLFGTLLSGIDTVDGSSENDTLGGYGDFDTVNGGAGLDRLSGGAGHDFLFGGVGDDQLFGNSGFDHLFGGEGRDTLTGGPGIDKFVFGERGAANADRINDFAHGDKIGFDDTFPEVHRQFSSVLPEIKFKAADDIAATGGATVDRNDHVLYDTDSGRLYYDTNGSDPGGRSLIATIFDTPDHHPVLIARDFVVPAG